MMPQNCVLRFFLAEEGRQQTDNRHHILLFLLCSVHGRSEANRRKSTRTQRLLSNTQPTSIESSSRGARFDGIGKERTSLSSLCGARTRACEDSSSSQVPPLFPGDERQHFFYVYVVYLIFFLFPKSSTVRARGRVQVVVDMALFRILFLVCLFPSTATNRLPNTKRTGLDVL